MVALNTVKYGDQEEGKKQGGGQNIHAQRRDDPASQAQNISTQMSTVRVKVIWYYFVLDYHMSNLILNTNK